MIVSYVFCGIGLLAAGVAVAEVLGRRHVLRRRVRGDRVEAAQGKSLIVSPPFGRSVSEFLPPPDDGRPQR